MPYRFNSAAFHRGFPSGDPLTAAVNLIIDQRMGDIGLALMHVLPILTDDEFHALPQSQRYLFVATSEAPRRGVEHHGGMGSMMVPPHQHTISSGSTRTGVTEAVLGSTTGDTGATRAAVPHIWTNAASVPPLRPGIPDMATRPPLQPAQAPPPIWPPGDVTVTILPSQQSVRVMGVDPSPPGRQRFTNQTAPQVMDTEPEDL